MKKKRQINSGSFKKGHIGYKALLGKHLSEKTKKKLSEIRKGKKHTEETKRKMSFIRMGNQWGKGLKGYKQTEEHKKKVSKGRKLRKKRLGYLNSLETRTKISKALVGRKLPEEVRKKMSENRKKEKHWNWQGGISCEPYSIDWTETLKRAIKERDKYICQLCGATPEILFIHHIDYDKKNCNPDNLITLCRSCHMKTNYNRNYWINYFNERMREKS